MYSGLSTSKSYNTSFNGKFIRVGKIDDFTRSYLTNLVSAKHNKTSCLEILRDKSFDVYVKDIRSSKSTKNQKFLLTTYKFNSCGEFFSNITITSRKPIEENIARIKNFIQGFDATIR